MVAGPTRRTLSRRITLYRGGPGARARRPDTRDSAGLAGVRREGPAARTPAWDAFALRSGGPGARGLGPATRDLAGLAGIRRGGDHAR